MNKVLLIFAVLALVVVGYGLVRYGTLSPCSAAHEVIKREVYKILVDDIGRDRARKEVATKNIDNVLAVELSVTAACFRILVLDYQGKAADLVRVYYSMARHKWLPPPHNLRF